MPKSTRLRVVCVAIAFNPLTDEILMVTSRKHPQKWIRPSPSSLFGSSRRA
jgi:hypothetical protein